MRDMRSGELITHRRRDDNLEQRLEPRRALDNALAVAVRHRKHCQKRERGENLGELATYVDVVELSPGNLRRQLRRPCRSTRS